MRAGMLMAACICAGVVSSASGQNLIHNPGFEISGGVSGAEGWATFNSARVRSIGDGFMPAALVRTGNASVELVGDGATDFSGLTTNVFDAVELEFFDPAIMSPGGDVVVTGWYNIPADRPLTTANAGIKLEFRRANSSVWQGIEALTINGHTNGDWVQFSLTVTMDEIDPSANPGEPPVAVSVLPIFFDGTGSETGTIFWDDFELTQGEACILAADRNNDNTTDVLDLLSFLEDWFPENGMSCP